jgi:quercetin dioxygenase-like cupin family protein
MRQHIWTLSLAGLLVLPAAANAQHHQPPSGQAAAGPHGSVSTSYDNLRWEVMVPELGADSPRISILRVDPDTRATQLMIHMPKQMHVPMHWHSANETHTVVRGTMVFEHEGQQHELGPGGFNYLPARTLHQAWSSDDALVFITVDSAWDVNFVQGPPSKGDLGQKPPAR